MNQVSTAQSAASPTIDHAEQHSATNEVLEATESRRWALEPRNDDKAWEAAGRIHKAFKCTQDEAYARIIAGRPLGIGAIASMRGIRFIEGNPNIMAELARAIMLSHPKVVEYFEPKGQPTATSCTFIAKRVGRPQQEFTFTLEMAIRAGLVDRGKDADAKKNNNYNKYPENMMAARATTTLAKLVAPELLLGMGVTEVEEEDAAVRATEQSRAEPSRPANAPVRDFDAELSALKSEVNAWPTLDVDEQTTLRAKLKAWTKEAPENHRMSIKSHYDAVVAAKPANGAAPSDSQSAAS